MSVDCSILSVFFTSNTWMSYAYEIPGYVVDSPFHHHLSRNINLLLPKRSHCTCTMLLIIQNYIIATILSILSQPRHRVTSSSLPRGSFSTWAAATHVIPSWGPLLLRLSRVIDPLSFSTPQRIEDRRFTSPSLHLASPSPHLPILPPLLSP